jgi:hypothetical protein
MAVSSVQSAGLRLPTSEINSVNLLGSKGANDSLGTDRSGARAAVSARPGPARPTPA